MTSHYVRGMNSSVYSDVIGSALTAGRTGEDIESLIKSNPGVALTGEDVVRQAYEIGAKVAINEMRP